MGIEDKCDNRDCENYMKRPICFSRQHNCCPSYFLSSDVEMDEENPIYELFRNSVGDF